MIVQIVRLQNGQSLFLASKKGRSVNLEISSLTNQKGTCVRTALILAEIITTYPSIDISWHCPDPRSVKIHMHNMHFRSALRCPRFGVPFVEAVFSSPRPQSHRKRRGTSKHPRVSTWGKDQQSRKALILRFTNLVLEVTPTFFPENQSWIEQR